MKTAAIILCFAGIIPASLVAGDTIITSNGTPIKLPDITVSNEITDLASGYAKAFQALSRQPISIVLRRGDKTVILKDVSNIKNFGGSLLIEIRAGLSYIVNPRDVIVITDDTRVDS